MHQISFADDAIDDVVSSKKRETLRIGENYGADEVLQFVRQNGEHIGFLRIVEKTEVLFSGLNEHDARAHNSKTLEHLQSRILSFYPTLTQDSILTRYRFPLSVEKSKEPRAGTSYSKAGRKEMTAPEQGRPFKKDTPGGVITARAFKYAGSFYAFADRKFPELRTYPPDIARNTMLQAAIIVSTLMLLERRSAGSPELHGGVALAFAPSVRDRHLAAIQALSCSLLQRGRAGLKPLEIPSFAPLKEAPEEKLVGDIGLWLIRSISGKREPAPEDLKIGAAAGRSAWTSAAMIVRMLR